LSIVADPARAFGQPVDTVSNVPTAIVAVATLQQGGTRAAARAPDISEASVRHAIELENAMEQRLAA
jgi:uncharacterized protein (DUF433 family)